MHEECKSCSFVGDNFAGALVHLAARDTSFAVISRTPIAKIGGFKNRMGWSFPWLSSFGTDVDCASDGSLTAPPAIPTAPIALPGVGRLVNGRFPANWHAVGERLEVAEYGRACATATDL